MTSINKKILMLCEERGWSTYELAQQSDITHSTLNSFINRDNAPKIDTLKRICDAFGISLSQFFIEDETLEMISEDEKKLIAYYRAMPKSKQLALLELVKN